MGVALDKTGQRARSPQERMRLIHELRTELNETHSRAFLLSRRLFRRVIKKQLKDETTGPDSLNKGCHIIQVADLHDVIESMAIKDHEFGPSDRVMLILEPSNQELRHRSRRALGRWLWRALFHASISLELSERRRLGQLSEELIWNLINQIGQTQFDEIRAAIHHQGLVVDPYDDSSIFTEFVASYSTLQVFDPDSFASMFPHHADHPHLEHLVQQQVDLDGFLEQARPASCIGLRPIAEMQTVPIQPEPETTASVSLTTATSLRAIANTLSEKGNSARTAILFATAARAQGRSGDDDLARARDALLQLASRLVEATDSRTSSVERLAGALGPLLAFCEKRRFNVEARLLSDLERACIAEEETSHQLAPLRWIKSLGRHALVQELRAQRRVQVLRRVRSAIKRVSKSRLNELEVKTLQSELGVIEALCEVRLRDDFRTLISAALESAHMIPSNRAESIEWAKLVEELLDRICNRGFINIGDLRDVIALNDLKMADVSGVSEFFKGDKLLQADACLAEALPGVYRRGEIYMRFLQRLSSLGFGTPLGRLLTLYAVLPFGGAFVVLEGLEHSIMVAVNKFVSQPMSVVSLASVIGTGFFLGGLIHSPGFRRFVHHSLKTIWMWCKFLLFDGPSLLINLEWVRRIRRHPIYDWGVRYLVKPSLATGIIWMIIRVFPLFGLSDQIVLALLFVISNLVLNSGPWRWFEEVLAEVYIRSWRAVRFRVLPGAFEIVMFVFNKMIEYMERAIYSVDEWLRLRSGENRALFVVKLMLNVPWFICTYLIRIYINLLVEPQVNPIKHFPVVTVSHKIILPLTKTLITLFATPLVPIFGVVIGNAIATATVVLLPGVFGFLVWEFKSNWRLYQANQGGGFKTEIIGDHSETMLRFMKPGFHSGTLPSLYQKLRRAQSLDQSKKRLKFEDGLHHVEAAIRRFTERFFIKSLSMAPSPSLWRTQISHIGLSSHRITVVIARGNDEKNFEVAFEEKSGWLVVGILQEGWLGTLDGPALGWFQAALIGYYKLAGVDLVREHLERELSLDGAYDIRRGQIVMWRPETGQKASVFDLSSASATPARKSLESVQTAGLFFSRKSLDWDDWVEFWSGSQPDGALVSHHVFSRDL
ncbi:MAG: hypothetical protein CMH52_06995 [Myxococcales bacterium]|nr:hypothetical protein [Myxococcales bacterium]